MPADGSHGGAPLREQEGLCRFKAAIEASPDAIVMVDDTGAITYANARIETTFGYARDAVIGQPVELLIPEAVRERHEGHRAGSTQGQGRRPMGIGHDVTGRRSDGTLFPAEVGLTPIETAEGREVVATILDTTSRKAAEAQVLQAKKHESIGRLAGGIAHDFNNMLFAISGYAELLGQDLAVENGRADLVVARQNLGALQQAAGRAAQLTGRLLAFSGLTPVPHRVVDLNAFIRALEPNIRRVIGANVHLTFGLHAVEGRIRADPGHLHQILVDLAINARDAMPDGGDLSIQTSDADFGDRGTMGHAGGVTGPHVLLTVSNTGVGMDGETLERLFEPLFTMTEGGTGAGLGLATIYGMVQQAGGRISVHAEPDHGSVFELSFPAVSEPVAGDEPGAVGSASSRSSTVMLVEDDAAVRNMTTQVLERAGHRVLSMADGVEALAAIAGGAGVPDVLVTAVVLPGMSGTQLAERVLERDAEAGVVLLSGFTRNTDDVDRLIARGSVFLGKPVGTSQLLAAIDRAIRRRSEGGGGR